MKKSFILIALILFVFNSKAQKTNLNLIVGTFTKNCESKGIYVYDFDTTSGDFKLKNNTEIVNNPSFLAISDDKKFIYTTNQNGSESFVSAFEFDSKSGNLKFLNKQNSNGNDPCFVLNDSKNVFLANYSGGNVTVFGKNIDGSLTPCKQVVQHFGKSINIKRQEKPHVHQIQFSPDKKFVFAVDLGVDKVYSYKYDADSNNNLLQKYDSIDIKAGSGPRHLTFSKNGKFVYLLQELDGTISAFRYKNGKLKFLEENTIISDLHKGDIGAADIHVSPDGKFLYATNRGSANEIVCFAIKKNGRLVFRFVKKTEGKTPRNFAIDPTGNFLLIANQNSNKIVIFKIDRTSGNITSTGKFIDICAPVCLVFSE